MECLSKNLQILLKRWPRWQEIFRQSPARDDVQPEQTDSEVSLRIGGLLLGSRYNRWEEAWQQASLVPKGSEEAWVYGSGLGDLPRALLQRKSLKTLRVVVMEPRVFQTVLGHFDQTDWLQDPRVELLTPPEANEVHHPFGAVVPELMLVEKVDGARLRDRILLELNTPFIGENQGATNEAVREQVDRNRERVLQDPDVMALRGGTPDCEAFVVGAGPTLEAALSWLPEAQEGRLVVAVDAAVRLLLSAGIIPDVIVAIDSHREGILGHFEALPLEILAQVPLVYFPRVHPDVLEAYPGPRFVSYSEEMVYQRLAVEIPRGKLFSSGSVIHPATDLAVQMGARTLILVGADFSYPGEVIRAGDGRFDTDHLRHWIYNGRGEKVPTQPNLRGYLRDLERYIERHPEVSFFNHSLDAADIANAPLWPGRAQ